MHQLLGLGYYPLPPKHLLHHDMEESLPRWVPSSIAWQVRWNNLVTSGRIFDELSTQGKNSVKTLMKMPIGDTPTAVCTPPAAWPMRFWGFWWRLTALGYAFEHLAWPYQMLLVDIATMELPAKGSQVMTRVNNEHEFTNWVHETLNADMRRKQDTVQETRTHMEHSDLRRNWCTNRRNARAKCGQTPNQQL